MEKRTIIFHVGQPKTGSSALQAFLSMNASKLEQEGISYPFPEGAKTIESGYCSGNLLHSMQRIAKKTRTNLSERPLELCDLFTDHFAETVSASLKEARSPTVLLSAEAIMSPVAAATLPVFQRLREDHHIKFVCFVRDPYDFGMSAWKQVTKTGRGTGSFEAFIRTRVENQTFGLERALRYLPLADEFKMINYDVHRGDIFSSFLEAIGVQNDLKKFDLPKQRQSNPSLSYSQAALLVAAREVLGSTPLVALLTKRFRMQQLIEPDPYFREIDIAILDYLGEVLQELNTLLPEGEKLRTAPRQEEHGGSGDVSLRAVQSVFEAIGEAVELEKKRPRTRLPKSLPADFDPLVYLLLNPDLQEAGVDPVRHYLENGRFEARVYK